MKREKIITAFCLMVGLCVAPVYAQGIFDSVVDWELTYDDNVKTEGSVEHSDGVYLLLGNGDDVWGEADEGFYVYTEETGSFSISAGVIWFDPGSNEWSKVGVMIREKPELPGSKTYYSLLRGNELGDQADAAWRNSEGGASSSTQMFEDGDDPLMAGSDGFLYLRVSRVVEKDLFFTEWSHDGENWNFGHNMTLEMDDTAGYGLFITSHTNDDYLVEAEAHDVTIEPFSAILGTRSLSSSIYVSDDEIDVTIELFNPGDSTQNVTVTETVPDGFTILEVNDDGNQSGQEITWNIPVEPGDETSVSYKVQSPSEFEGKGQISGDVDGIGTFGASTISGIIPLALEHKKEVPFINRSIELDGVLGEDEWDGANTFSFDVTDGDNPPGVVQNAGSLSSHDMTVHLFHNNDYIFCALDVTDPVLDFESAEDGGLWNNDSVELYLDGNMSRLSTKEGNQYGPQMTVAGDGRFALGNDPPTPIELPDGGHYSEDGSYWNYGASVRDDESGYAVEYQLDKSMMLDPPDIKIVGFDILVNDASNTGSRTGKWGWFNIGEDGEVDEFWNNETGWGLIELMEGTSVPDWSMF